MLLCIYRNTQGNKKMIKSFKEAIKINNEPISTPLNSEKKRFYYMLLDRLKQDCYGYIAYGRRLWGTDTLTHATTMVALYKAVNEKPLGFAYKELQKLYYALTKTELTQELYNSINANG
jgi:hypothetical protein